MRTGRHKEETKSQTEKKARGREWEAWLRHKVSKVAVLWQTIRWSENYCVKLSQASLNSTAHDKQWKRRVSTSSEVTTSVSCTLQLQIISFDNIMTWLHYNLIIFIWRSHPCCKATGKWNQKVCATAQCLLGLGTMAGQALGSGPLPARQLIPALLFLPNSLQSVADWPIYTATQDPKRSCDLLGEAMQITRLVKKRRKWEGEPVLRHSSPAQQALLEGSREWSRKQLMEHHL